MQVYASTLIFLPPFFALLTLLYFILYFFNYYNVRVQKYGYWFRCASLRCYPLSVSFHFLFYFSFNLYIYTPRKGTRICFFWPLYMYVYAFIHVFCWSHFPFSLFLFPFSFHCLSSFFSGFHFSFSFAFIHNADDNFNGGSNHTLMFLLPVYSSLFYHLFIVIL